MNPDDATDAIGATAIRRVLVGRVVWAVFALLTVPLAIGALDTRLMTPLALPGYLLMMAMTIVGSYVAPQYRFWLYWAPFALCAYAIGIAVAAGYHLLRSRRQ